MAAEYVQVCNETDFDTTTLTCASPYYAPNTTGLPALSLDDAAQIGAACALLWATAWVIRRLKKHLDQS